MSETTTQPGVYAFDYVAWSLRYPELAGNVSQGQASVYFDQATDILNNTPRSLVRDVAKRGRLLGLLVAHIATLFLPSSQGGNGGVVGRTSDATRGSVSISLDMGDQEARAAWFNQTQYGALFWTATTFLRQARYVPGFPQRPWIFP